MVLTVDSHHQQGKALTSVTMLPNERQRRIIQLSQQWSLTLPPVTAPLTRPGQIPSFQTPADDQTAEDLLQRRAAEIAQLRPKSGLSRAFSSSNLKKGKHWDPKEVVEVLASWIGNGGSPGVVEALLGKLAASGVELSGIQKQKGGLLNRRRSTEAFVDRSRLLRLAVEGNHIDVLRVLLPHADGLSLDASLPLAMRTGNMPIVELLLKYGANAGQTPEGQDAFRQACAVQGRAQMIAMVMQSEGSPSPVLVSQAMNDATRAGCIDNVLALSRTNADGNYNQAEALQSAVAMGRRDIALAIVMGNRPPTGPSLNQAFRLLIDNSSLSPGTKLDISELLLCAGAGGDIPAIALERAVESQFYDMAYLLTSYGVSIEHNNAAVVKKAISTGQLDLVTALLNERAVLNPALASSCVSLISKQAQFEERNTLLTLLLKKGANGVALDQCLIDAAESGDLSSVELLLHPQFPQSLPNGHTPNRHSVASPNYKSGEALRTAVLKADTLLADKILAARPSSETLSSVFPLTRNLAANDRTRMISLFLQGPLSGSCLHSALQDELGAPPSQRDESLIKALLDRDADINFKHGEGLVPLIKQMDLKLLSTIIPRISPQTAAVRIPDAMGAPDHRTRYEIVNMLLRAGAAIGMKQIADSLLITLSEKPVDMSLLRLLLEQGNGDVNGLEGAICRKAVENPDPKVLELLFTFGKPSDTNVMQALNDIAAQFSTESKTWKLKIVLDKSARGDDLNRVLLGEVQTLIKDKDRKPSFSTLKQLLESGADPNAYKAAALCHAVIAAHITILDLFFSCRNQPTAPSLGLALPHAMRISDPEVRLATSNRLVNAGAPPSEANRALLYAINTYPADMQLAKVLAAKADMSDGEALSSSINKESPDLVDLILKSSLHSVELRNSALGQVMEIKNRAARKIICQSLLSAGVSTQIASAALLVAARDGDLSLGETLMAHGASISSNNGQAIIEASRGGSVEVLNVLLKSDTDSSVKTLEQAFQGATETRDLSKRAVIFELLLNRGVKGELVDAQLQSAARYGADGEGILKVLLAAGADPNYNHGEALVAATRSAFMGSIALLLGIWNEGDSQKKASQPTLIRSLKACWSLNRVARYEIVQNLFKAGLDVSEDIHIALNDAVNEEDPEERLVKLLLQHGASPMANDCKTLIDASQNMASSSLSLLLERDIAEKDIKRAFNGAFTTATFQNWFTERGLATAKMLLDKGAKGDAITTALVCVMENAKGPLADEFVHLLVIHGPDVNFNHGQPLQVAASKANGTWTRRLLDCHPTSETLSLAFQCIFDTALPQDEVLDLFKSFAEYRDGGVGIDVMATLQGTDPVLARAIKQYPRSPLIVETLLDAGYYHDQPVQCILHEGAEPEEVTLLTWAIAQPQKRVSSAVIELLVERGANVNAVSPASSTTPVMLAIQQRRPDLVKSLLIDGAEVDVMDALGQTPLSMATAIGGDTAIQMMSSILAAEPCRDDGSLHNAARELNLAAIKILVQAGHDPDFPSPLHEGRSALGEICLHGSRTGELTPERERQMQKAMAFLIDSGSDTSVKANDKSILYLCFDAADPVATTRALLKSGVWKYINKPFNHYSDEKYTYSPTMYITKVMRQTDNTMQLLSVLRASRATDVFYANSGPQPDGAVGIPEDMAVIERARKAREERLAEESQEHAIALNRKREIANVEHQILVQRAEMEDARRRRQHTEDLAAIRSRAQLEESVSASALQRRLADQAAVTEAALNRTRAIAATEAQAENNRQKQALEWEAKMNKERIDNARAIGAVKISEREEVERIDRAAETRIAKRIEMQKKLVESQEKLARTLANGPGGSQDARRQIGYVTEIN